MGNPLKTSSECSWSWSVARTFACVAVFCLGLSNDHGAFAARTPTQFTAVQAGFSCPVSRPNGGQPKGTSGSAWYHGSHGLWILLWARGTAVVDRSMVLKNGRLYVKTPWWRDAGSYGRLKVTGHRLDRPAPPLRADVPVGYGPSGFQATALIFPTYGCWLIKGRSGMGRLTIVERVVRA